MRARPTGRLERAADTGIRDKIGGGSANAIICLGASGRRCDGDEGEDDLWGRRQSLGNRLDPGNGPKLNAKLLAKTGTAWGMPQETVRRQRQDPVVERGILLIAEFNRLLDSLCYCFPQKNEPNVDSNLAFDENFNFIRSRVKDGPPGVAQPQRLPNRIHPSVRLRRRARDHIEGARSFSLRCFSLAARYVRRPRPVFLVSPLGLPSPPSPVV